MLGQVVAVKALDSRKVHLTVFTARPNFGNNVRVVFVCMRHIAVVNFSGAKFAPDHRAVIVLFVHVQRLGVVHFLQGVVKPLFLDIFEVIPVGMLIERVYCGKDLWTK